VVSEEIGAAENPINNPVGVVLPTGSTSPLRLLHHFCTHSRFKRGNNDNEALSRDPSAGRGRLNLACAPRNYVEVPRR